MTLPSIKDKKVTCSNSSLELSIEIKYSTELIPVKSYKKDLIFLVAKTLKDITNHSLRASKGVFTKIAYTI